MEQHNNLHVGLLSLDRRKLISPSDEPELFWGDYDTEQQRGLEFQAKELLAQRSIIASGDRGLNQFGESPATKTHGYLLRESRRVDPSEHNLTLFTIHEVHDFLQTEPKDVRGYFLRQILKYMN